MAEIRTGATSDGRLTFLEAGLPDAIPLVFLHGVGGGANAWRPQLERFGEGYRAIAWNMPGYGGSALIEPMSIGLLGESLRHLVADLSLAHPVLVGHSIGGMIIQSYLADELGPARAVVLAQTSPAFGGKDPGWARAFVDARLGPLDRGETMASMAPGAIADLVGDDPDPAGLAAARACFAAVPEETWRASVHALIGFDRREALGRISVPALLLAGSKDRNAPAPTVAKMAERIPGAAYVCLDGVGHLVAQERPQAFAATLETFLARYAPASGARA